MVIVVSAIIVLGAGIGLVALEQTSSTTTHSSSSSTTFINVTSTTGSSTLSSTSYTVSHTSSFFSSQIITTSTTRLATPPISVTQTNSNCAAVMAKPTGWLTTDANTAKLLLKHDAKVDEKIGDGKTPLSMTKEERIRSWPNEKERRVSHFLINNQITRKND